MIYKKIKVCRSCKKKNLVSLFSLGNLYFTGIFPKNTKCDIPKGPLNLIFCKFCNLVQLDRNFNLKIMYGNNYGYRSSLNSSMVNHLRNKSVFLKKIIKLKKNNTIIDIGSNDGTFLSFFKKECNLIGVDPTIKKFKKYYRDDIKKIPHFFSYNNLKKKLKGKKAKLITSISMLYDLEDTIKFARDVYDCLDKDGIWHFEQSYLPKMLESMSFDSICHEHLEYYSLKSILYILNEANLKIINIKENNINGGSIAITVAKRCSSFKEKSKQIKTYLEYENKKKIFNVETYKKFFKKIESFKIELNKLIKKIINKKKIIIGYGASTKGNVLLQYCGLNNNKIKFIAEVNKDKYNKYTPGSKIKIISEKSLKKLNFDYLLFFPWHYKNFFLKKRIMKKKKIKYIFPLPKIEIV